MDEGRGLLTAAGPRCSRGASGVQRFLLFFGLFFLIGRLIFLGIAPFFPILNLLLKLLDEFLGLTKIAFVLQAFRFPTYDTIQHSPLLVIVRARSEVKLPL